MKVKIENFLILKKEVKDFETNSFKDDNGEIVSYDTEAHDLYKCFEYDSGSVFAFRDFKQDLDYEEKSTIASAVVDIYLKKVDNK